MQIVISRSSYVDHHSMFMQCPAATKQNST